MSEADSAAVASFEAKWSQAYPEFGLALRFAHGETRAAQGAFSCLVFEIEHAAFGIREAQPAAIKLQWWAEEFSRVAKGEARHPLTQALAARAALGSVPLSLWQQVIVGALAQRDVEPAPDAATLIAGIARLHEPLGAIDAMLFGTNAETVSGALAIVRALRETAALPDALRDGKLPLPLDLLARHRLARGDLAAASAARAEALREWLATLARELSETAPSPASLGVVFAAIAAADARRAREASRADDPLAALRTGFARLSFPVLWSAWRAARRSRT